MTGRVPLEPGCEPTASAAKDGVFAESHPSRKTVPLLSALREPPVVGRYYMVPAVRYRLRSIVRAWPVMGPIHDDARDLKFPHLHYHLDGRFMSDALIQAIRTFGRDHETNLNGVVLVEPVEIETDKYAQRHWGRLPRRPELRRLRCYRAEQRYTAEARRMLVARVGIDAISSRLGPVAEAIRLSDGRLLCPHRKVDLSQFEPDAEGIVTCPLHGLRVKCLRDTDRSPEGGDAKQGSTRSARAGAEGIAKAPVTRRRKERGE